MIYKHIFNNSSEESNTQSTQSTLFSSNSSVSDIMEFFVKSYLVGAVAGVISKSSIAPLDRVSHMKFTYKECFKQMKKIYIEDGWKGFWKGNSATIVRVFPYAGFHYLLFDLFSRIIQPEDGIPLTPMQRFLAGSAAGTTSVAIVYPLDLTRARMAIQPKEMKYKNIFQAIKTMIKTEGWRSLYNGLTPAVIGEIPYAGLSWMTYETSKELLGDKTGKSLNGLQRFLCGALAAVVAQTLTYPLDIVRRRLQTDGFYNANTHTYDTKKYYTTILKTLKHVIQTEDLRGLFKGVTLNWIKGPICLGISFTMNDTLRMLLNIYRN